jgi:DNA-binding MarR family transcriptional regulator
VVPLDDYVPYLLNRAGARIAASFTDEVRPLGITLPMWRVLAALNERDGQSVGELSGRTSIEYSTLSRVLDGLQRRGLVGRRRTQQDGRVVNLHLTPAGRAMTRRVMPIAEYHEQVLIADMSESDVATLKRLLRALYDNMDWLGTRP